MENMTTIICVWIIIRDNLCDADIKSLKSIYKVKKKCSEDLILRFLGNDQFSGGLLGPRRSKIFPTGSIEVFSFFYGRGWNEGLNK